MKKFLGVLANAVCLVGCVSDHMDNRLGFLVGQNIQFAVGRLGDPDSQRTVLSDKIYVWSSSRNVTIPATNTTNGIVGGSSLYGTTTGTGYVAANRSCTIQLATTADGTIKSWRWSGSMGGCTQYARRLSLP